ncbi:MAG TPA: alpha-glucan family phosphorylase [Pyrinomonadaceae bacterium]|nr:alpha-glucan family phosphorylase [Pyrinomonadaceae bacterium]
MNNVHKDPVCGMSVLSEKGLIVSSHDQTVYLCSEFCRDKFLAQPEKYLALLVKPSHDEAKENRRVAYFSMEVALSINIPTYSGGLGVLAGDMLKSCADLRVPVVGVTLLSRKGYFDQRLDEWGNQQEAPVRWAPSQFLRPLTESVQVEIEQRAVQVRAWEDCIIGSTGYIAPLILLDTDVEGNSEYDRALTDYLYGGDDKYRLAQEIVLGIGGARILNALGYTGIERFHMNEGHAALLALELLKRPSATHAEGFDFDVVRNQCVFTTHTPVPAGLDQFGYDLVQRVLGDFVPMDALTMLGGHDRLNMTLLALNLSHYENGVAKRHEEVSREMFPGYPISHITNGVHSLTWTCESFRELYDSYIPDWRNDPPMLRKAIGIPDDDVWRAHVTAKSHLLEFIRQRTNQSLAADVFTIGFARRATPYKRADLIFSDVHRLLEVTKQTGPVQFVFAGKAHPKDYGGKDLIRHIVKVSLQLSGQIPIVYLENYDMEMARLIVSGVDLWLNTPQRPLEASGTSGMKAAHNGVPSFSTLDGWWIEGCVEGLTGWSIGTAEAGSPDPRLANEQDAEDLYRKLSDVIMPTYYQVHERWIEVMRHVIGLNASYFNTHRMVQQYVTNAYLP